LLAGVGPRVGVEASAPAAPAPLSPVPTNAEAASAAIELPGAPGPPSAEAEEEGEPEYDLPPLEEDPEHAPAARTLSEPPTTGTQRQERFDKSVR
jgi:hypothetical protein